MQPFKEKGVVYVIKSIEDRVIEESKSCKRSFRDVGENIILYVDKNTFYSEGHIIKVASSRWV